MGGCFYDALLKTPKISVQIPAPPPKIQEWIDNQLTWTVVRHIASAVDSHDFKRSSIETLAGDHVFVQPASPCREDMKMLE